MFFEDYVVYTEVATHNLFVMLQPQTSLHHVEPSRYGLTQTPHNLQLSLLTKI